MPPPLLKFLATPLSAVYQHFTHEVSKFRSKVAVEDFQDCDASGVARNFKRGAIISTFFSSVVFSAKLI